MQALAWLVFPVRAYAPARVVSSSDRASGWSSPCSGGAGLLQLGDRLACFRWAWVAGQVGGGDVVLGAGAVITLAQVGEDGQRGVQVGGGLLVVAESGVGAAEQ